MARLRAGADKCRRNAWASSAGYRRIGRATREHGTTTTPAGARIPYLVEAWAVCSRPAQKGEGAAHIDLLVNRSMTAATLHATSWPEGIAVRGCGLHRGVAGPGTGDYEVVLG